jgi:hypothetical protein
MLVTVFSEQDCAGSAELSCPLSCIYAVGDTPDTAGMYSYFPQYETGGE